MTTAWLHSRVCSRLKTNRSGLKFFFVFICGVQKKVHPVFIAVGLSVPGWDKDGGLPTLTGSYRDSPDDGPVYDYKFREYHQVILGLGQMSGLCNKPQNTLNFRKYQSFLPKLTKWPFSWFSLSAVRWIHLAYIFILNILICLPCSLFCLIFA